MRTRAGIRDPVPARVRAGARGVAYDAAGGFAGAARRAISFQ